MEFLFSFFLAALIPLVLLLWYPNKVSVVVVSAFVAFVLGMALRLKRQIWSYTNPIELNQVLEQTGKTIFLYSIIFVLVWVMLPA